MLTYEVHADDKGKWILYQTGDGGFDLIGWFADKDDAFFVRQAFEDRETARLEEVGTSGGDYQGA